MLDWTTVSIIENRGLQSDGTNAIKSCGALRDHALAQPLALAGTVCSRLNYFTAIRAWYFWFFGTYFFLWLLLHWFELKN